MPRILPFRATVTIGLVVIALFQGASALAEDRNHPLYESEFHVDSMHWEQLADGTFRLDMAGARRIDVTGEPDLPAVDLLFLVPADLAVIDVRIEPLSVRSVELPGPLALARPILTSSGEQAAQRHLAPRDGVFPPDWGAFGGLHGWHGYRLLAVTVFPVRQHNPAGSEDARLEQLEHFAIHAVTAQGSELPPLLTRERKIAGERQQREQILRQVVANPEAIGGYSRHEGLLLDKQGAPYLPASNPSLEGSAVRYLIVTSDELAAEFQRLADHRTAQGLPAKVVTREWIEATQRHGVDFQETLRMYLQQAYAKWGTEFLLLGGDTAVIPARYARSTFYGALGYTMIPTDWYFACLDGNWNANGNGWFAEPPVLNNPGDNADLAPELAIGRAPVRTPLGVQQFVDKAIAYEASPAGAQYANRILFAAEQLFTYLDGAQYTHLINEDFIQPCSDMTAVRLYETDTFPREMPLTLSAFLQQANSGNFGHVCHIGHAHYYNMSMNNANFIASHADALTNAPNFFFLYGLNCSSAAFDVACISSRLVANPNGGSIVSIGSAREAFPTYANNYMRVFYDHMVCHGVTRSGPTMNNALLHYIGQTHNNTAYRWTHLNMVILGDPSIAIWNGAPLQPQISGPEHLSAGEQTVQIAVAVGGAPVTGAVVCLAKDDETYASTVTDETGNAWLDVIPQASGSMILTISGSGLARTIEEIPVNGSATYVSLSGIAIDDQSGNGNGLPEAGELLALQLELRDVGGAGASGVIVNVTSNHPDLAVLEGVSSAPDIPPAGIVTTIDPIMVQTPPTVRDGTSMQLRVAVSADGGGHWISQGVIEVLAPEPEMIRLVIDGELEDGELLVLRPYVKNYGSGRLDQLLIQLVDPAPGVDIHEGMAMIVGLEPSAEASYLTGELSLTIEDIGMEGPARLTFVDNYGRQFSQALEFNPPAAPSLPVADATRSPDAISLRWDPVGGDRTLGYHVYRADDPGGPFIRTNQDLLKRVSYYEDRPLEQLTPYWYMITAVDTFFVEGVQSPVIEQSTMPAELDNFPLTFTSMTSSHLAVGDVNGDGRLEIVLASDEVYVWRDDGSELLDGDDDPLTTGPFTNVSGQFEPAGVVLADMDGLPGLEIIVSERLNDRQIHIYRSEGTMLPGWPRTLQSSWNWATPAVGDVTGDGFNEVVVNDTAGRTFVWRHDGTELMDGDNDPQTDGVFVVRAESWGFSSPALYDLDGDGAMEIIFGTKYSNDQNALLAYKSDQTQAPGFPFPTGQGRILCSPAIADLDRSGTKEIVFHTHNHGLFVVRSNGNLYPGFPVQRTAQADNDAGPSPAVGDFTGDGNLEIVWPANRAGGGMDLLLVDINGAIQSGWPVQLPSRTEASPVVGDINGDGVPDIIQPTEDGYIHAFNADGSPVAGFPIKLSGPGRATPVICDLNGDGKVNIVYGSGDRLLHAWSMPFQYNLGLVPWPTFQGNNQRTGQAFIVSATSVADSELPPAFTVLPPYPNPFNPSTTIRLFVAPDASRNLEVSIFDLRGRRVRQLFAGPADPGWHSLTWNGCDDAGRQLGSGVYFVQARQGSRMQTFKLALLK